jgi:hypothetical protein
MLSGDSVVNLLLACDEPWPCCFLHPHRRGLRRVVDDDRQDVALTGPASHTSGPVAGRMRRVMLPLSQLFRALAGC